MDYDKTFKTSDEQIKLLKNILESRKQVNKSLLLRIIRNILNNDSLSDSEKVYIVKEFLADLDLTLCK